jgi:alkanesulfonate monooxygenase SsuD/methylene tetrahydromethanopterin reductase-like flavin-dependent oxidoreductase (luciferase family)
VSLVAQHDPIVLAKQIATLDLLSNGRFVLGIGFGWNRQEAVNHGVAFAQRRQIAREKVLCMKALWSQEAAEFHGEFVELPPSFAWPKPQTGGIPILVGGAPIPSNFEAITEYGDGWMPIGGSGISGALVELKQRFESAGRDPAELRVVPFGTIPTEGKLAHLAAIGCTEVVLRVRGEESSTMLQTLDSHLRFLSGEWASDE